MMSYDSKGGPNELLTEKSDLRGSQTDALLTGIRIENYKKKLQTTKKIKWDPFSERFGNA